MTHTNVNAAFPEKLTEEITALFDHYPEKNAALIPALHLVQERFGYISNASMEQLSDIIGVPPAEVFGTLTFYTMFRREPSGQYHINVCKNLSCTLTGSGGILEHLEKTLGIRAGETTEDGVFTLGTAECLGACSEAPVMEIDGEYFFRLTPEKVDEILAKRRELAKNDSPAAEDEKA